MNRFDSNDLIAPLNAFETLFDDPKFLEAVKNTLEGWQDIQAISNILHSQTDIFDSLDGLIICLKEDEKMHEYLNQLEALRDLIQIYACIKEIAPRAVLLLRYAIIFVIDEIVSTKTDKIVLDETAVKNLSVVYTTIILNLATNPKSWMGTNADVSLVDWRKDIEVGKIDREIFMSFRSYLRNKF